MLRALGHLRRLQAIARILARHDALFPLQRPEAPPLLAWLAARYARHYRRPGKGAAKRPGVRLAQAMYELGPSFIKLGQALSVRADVVGDELAEDLGQLRDRLPPFSGPAARAAIAAEFGKPVEDLFRAFDEKPVAAASIAQVHLAETSDGREVAVKVLRPGIEAAFRRDLDLFFWLAEWAERVSPEMRRLRPVKVIETVREAVAHEMDLRFEAAAADELARNFTGDPDFRVPTVDWRLTGRRVLTLARVRGIPIADNAALKAAGHDLGAIAVKLIGAFLKQAMRDGFFHADLHHGNLFVAPDGAIEAVDFGIVGRLDRPTRQFMAQILLALIDGDYTRAAELHFAAGYVPADKSVAGFAQALRSVGEPILGRPGNEISIGRLLAHLFHVTERFAMATQPQLLLLQKTMVAAEGVARGLDPETNFWTAARPVIEGWMTDNLGVESKVRDAAATLNDMAQRLPGFAAKLEQAAQSVSDSGVRLDDDSLRRLARHQGATNRALAIAAWVLVIQLGLVLLALWF
jgi:ubiquinone biosynthesis protein